MKYVCTGCKRIYPIPAEKCIFCDSKLSEQNGKAFTVVSSTEVFVPSIGHENAPYFDLLIQDENGNFEIKKSYKEYKDGQEFNPSELQATGLAIGVVGTGTMGIGIAEAALMRGIKVVLLGRSDEKLKIACNEIRNFFAKRMSEADANRAMENLTSSADFSSLKDSPLIIESITEDLKIKREYFQKLEAACGKHAAFASNTSSLLIGDLAANLKDPSRMIGIHFFNPATKMALVEIVKTEESSDAALKAALDFAKAIGKTPVIVKDSPCFVVNRIMAVYLNEAAILYQEKIASREDIDNSIRLGLNHPMGPLALMDFIGLDIFAEIMKNLYEKTSDKKYLPAKIISDLVARGKLGRKSGEGFYKY